MRHSRTVPGGRRQVASLDAGWRLSAWMVPAALGGFVCLAAVSMCRSRPAHQQADDPQAPAPMRGQFEVIREMAIGPGEATLMLRLVSARFLEYSLDGRRPVRWIDLSQTTDVSAATLSADGTTLAAGCRDGSVVVRRNGRTSVVKVHDAPVAALACTKDGKHVASAARGSLVLWAATTGRVIWRHEHASLDAIRLAFSADGRRLLASHAHELIQVWDVTGPAVLRSVRPISAASCVSFSPDGRTLVTGSHGGHLEIRNLESGCVRLIRRSSDEPLSVPVALAFSPDGRLLACGRLSGAVELWDVATGSRAARITRHAGPVWALRFSATSDKLFSTTAGTICVWDLQCDDEADRIDLSAELQCSGPR